ncbi:MAG: hypothetical protein JWR59_2247 [Brevundimonas sp.]|nr:hypothetical protein [Brevundimonas sp.]
MNEVANQGVDPNDAQRAIELERDEACVRHAYKDSRGYWTIGIGRLIDKTLGGGITREEALYLKRNDIVRFKGELDLAAPWWRTLDPVRQRAVLNMTFNLGLGLDHAGLCEFSLSAARPTLALRLQPDFRPEIPHYAALALSHRTSQPSLEPRSPLKD